MLREEQSAGSDSEETDNAAVLGERFPEFPRGDLIVKLVVVLPETLGNGTDTWKQESRREAADV